MEILTPDELMERINRGSDTAFFSDAVPVLYLRYSWEEFEIFAIFVVCLLTLKSARAKARNSTNATTICFALSSDVNKQGGRTFALLVLQKAIHQLFQPKRLRDKPDTVE